MKPYQMSMRELKENGIRLTPKLAEEIQQEIFRKMSPEKRAESRRQFFEMAEKLNMQNDRKIK